MSDNLIFDPIIPETPASLTVRSPVTVNSSVKENKAKTNI